MLRATDTGRSGWIDARGRWVDALPESQLGALEAAIHPHAGLTPYMQVDDRLAIGGAALLLLLGLLAAPLRQRHRVFEFRSPEVNA